MKTLTILLMSTICFSASAQNEKIGLGVMAEFLISSDHGETPIYTNIQGEGIPASKSVLPSFSAGLFYRLAKGKFYMRNELLISQRGTKSKSEQITVQGGISIIQKNITRMTFFDVNILPGVNLNNFLLNIGPSLAVHLNSKTIVKYEPVDEFKGDIEGLPAVDIGAIAALGYLIPIHKVSVLFDLRFTQYFNNSHVHDKLFSINAGAGLIF